MSIGSGSSKPMIRGLGFNRVVVAENGMKHEGQQWGDDHGLEADQYAVDRVEVIKGPAALAYGSDAIGGVIDLHSDAPPQSRFGGRLRLFARTNNESVGTSLRVEGRGRRLWYKADATLVSYADYGIPADSIRYHSYYIRLHRRRLRNTAGREADASLAAGFESGPWRAFVRVAAVSTRSGYFANAHGLEVMLSDIDYDSSRRDIDLPSQTALHLSATARAGRSWAGGGAEACLAWQANSRRERSSPLLGTALHAQAARHARAQLRQAHAHRHGHGAPAGGHVCSEGGGRHRAPGQPARRLGLHTARLRANGLRGVCGRAPGAGHRPHIERWRALRLRLGGHTQLPRLVQDARRRGRLGFHGALGRAQPLGFRPSRGRWASTAGWAALCSRPTPARASACP